jgi:hypothetical protein
MVRKPDSVERNEWVELSASANKKLIKLISLWRKKEEKMAKEGERLDKEKREAEERDRQRREEAKSIVLVDDVSRGEAKKVSLKHIMADEKLVPVLMGTGQGIPGQGPRRISSPTTRMGPPIPTSKDQLLHPPSRRYRHDSMYPYRRLYQDY